MGGESNFLFTYTPDSQCRLESVSSESWQLPAMLDWTEENIQALLDDAEAALQHCLNTLNLPAKIVRKLRAVGIVPVNEGVRLAREQLEETVLVTQRRLEMSSAGKQVPFCAFNGGNDVSRFRIRKYLILDLTTLP